MDFLEKIYLSIVIPAYNEEQMIEKTISKLIAIHILSSRDDLQGGELLLQPDKLFSVLEAIKPERFYLGNRIRAVTVGCDLTLWAIEDGNSGRLLKLEPE